MEKIIEIKNLSYSYRAAEGEDVTALKNVNLDVFKGEFLVIAGHNGSGKSTLAKHMNGLLLPTSGKIFVNGIPTSDDARIFEIRSSVGMVFQNPDNQTVATFVEDDIAFGPENLGVPRDEIERRIDEALAAVGMSGHRKSTPQKMSGGQKQRIAIAGVLAMKPQILVLDESTSMLDPRGRKEVVETARKLNGDGITVILITHNMEEAFFADRIAVMRDGRIAAAGTPKEIFTDTEILYKNRLMLPPLLEIQRLLRLSGYDTGDPVFTEGELADKLAAYCPGCDARGFSANRQ
ncbi:MAG: energy-coupling factor transporter ATPase [Clostridiales bacterium]|jgi:energy-coupling factor transport system ATP-binding protein|nr:energy-coupling factor transporter ATPase [Clostridiales bacterium]